MSTVRACKVAASAPTYVLRPPWGDHLAEPSSVEITSHADGERVYGVRTITLAGTAANTSQVQVLLDGSVVATLDVDAAADFVLGQASFTTGASDDDDQDGVPDATPLSGRSLGPKVRG